MPTSLVGMSVLDVGAANGAACFEVERRGVSRVVAVDIDSGTDFGFERTRDFLGSRAEFIRASIYELPELLSAQFDLVFFFGVLYHLRHPLLALDKLHRLVRPGGSVLIETVVCDDEIPELSDRPAALFYPRDELNGDASNWFAPTVQGLIDWCETSGFAVELRVRRPSDRPHRCLVRASRSTDPPVYQCISYERPIRATVERSAAWSIAASAHSTSETDHSSEQETSLPLPPPEMRALVGPTDVASFDNPSGALVFPDLPPGTFESVFDFGCGCGRIARQFIQQRPSPERYVGIDLHAGMIAWCSANLAPRAPQFRFVHHDEYNLTFNPSGRPDALRFPVMPDERFTFVNAWSVFTHIPHEKIEFYLAECAKILAPNGIFQSTWFLFDKSGFPMMQEDQHALYINTIDPTNAVIVDYEWLDRMTSAQSLVITSIVPPAVRGFQWLLRMQQISNGVTKAPWPADTAPVGIVRAPHAPAHAHRIGLPE